ncbi:hypothetical protein AgCh_018419 [Apium graveolens]
MVSIFRKCSSFAIVNPSKVTQVSWKPRAFVYEGFLTDDECDHLISIAKPELKRSSVADNESGESKLSEVRTSSGVFIDKAKDPIVAGIEEKIATWSFLPKAVYLPHVAVFRLSSKRESFLALFQVLDH